MLSNTFKGQVKKWIPLTRAHVSNAILVVHDFICGNLEAACPDPTVRASIWSFIFEEIQDSYKRAMKYTDFLLAVELEGRKMTYNPEKYKSVAEDLSEFLEGVFSSESAAETIRQDIHGVLRNYYDIARSRFVDVVCQQVIIFT